ncbi:hypothetical protein AAG570_003412 [Ranatra chinensis]|uniref:Odorant receptor n=1 Tax=Ranatra chinensis TaxID=642074 RepID=A0ABD0Y3K7_9HEMI
MAEWREELRLADDAVRLEYGWLLEAACLFPRLEGWSAPLALLHVAVVVSVGILSSSLLSVTVLMSLSDMAVLSETIHFLFLAVISLCILIVFNAERSIFVRGHALLAHFYRYEEADEEPPPERVAALREDVDRYKSLWLFFWPAYMSTCATFLVLLHAFSDSGTAEYSSVNTQLPFSYWTPWDSRVGRYYSLTLCLQTIHIYSCALALSSGLIVYISFSRNLCFQLGLLRLSISRLRQRAEWYYVKTTGHSPLTVAKLDPSTDETLRRCYQHCLKRNIEHHVRIYE